MNTGRSCASGQKLRDRSFCEKQTLRITRKNSENNQENTVDGSFRKEVP